MKCASCQNDFPTATEGWQKEKEELIQALQLASCRTQGYEDGWLCPNCAKVKKIKYKEVERIMADLPDRKFWARNNRKVTVE